MSEFEALQQVVRELRDPETGCPWDRALTHEELKPTCIEEAAEVISGINILRETGNPEGLQEELGDLLLQVVMHAQIAEEEGLFTMDDVCRTVREKMVRRHPHVFSRKSGADTQKHSAASGTQEHSAGAGTEDQSAGAGTQNQSAGTGAQEQLTWDEIKRREKGGKEWMDAYLPDALLEARELVDRARRRKGFLEE
ncbi:MAG: nucleotide pyrophosphohydrolase [Eubacterium sp.]|nr:nucleotide pyrophosphohydrolase [Eubacterium sp.]